VSEPAAGRLNLKPRARFLAFGLSGVDPHLMLHGNPDQSGTRLTRLRP